MYSKSENSIKKIKKKLNSVNLSSFFKNSITHLIIGLILKSTQPYVTHSVLKSEIIKIRKSMELAR